MSSEDGCGGSVARDGLEVRGLTVRRGGRRVVDVACLRARRGEFVGIRGPTGCGKTTLLRAVAGLECAEGGSVYFDGRAWESPEAREPAHRRRVGMAFQHLGLWPHMSAVEHIMYVLDGRGEPSGAGAARAWMARFGIEALAERRPGEMSGGQRHLLSLARALAGRPNLVLLDEAFSGLDDDLKIRAAGAVLKAAEEFRFAGIAVSHDASDIARLCSRCFRMRDGRLEAQP